ncbi:hypothetical protein D3C85_1566530 [compost metagenome]
MARVHHEVADTAIAGEGVGADGDGTRPHGIGGDAITAVRGLEQLITGDKDIDALARVQIMKFRQVQRLHRQRRRCRCRCALRFGGRKNLRRRGRIRAGEQQRGCNKD